LAIADVGLASTHFSCLPAYRWFVQPADMGAPRDDARRSRGRCGRCGRCGLSRRWGPWGPFSARAALFPVVAGQPGVAPSRSRASPPAAQLHGSWLAKADAGSCGGEYHTDRHPATW